MSGSETPERITFARWLDTIVEAPGQGTDTVTTSAAFTLPANVERLFLTVERNDDRQGFAVGELLG